MRSRSPAGTRAVRPLRGLSCPVCLALALRVLLPCGGHFLYFAARLLVSKSASANMASGVQVADEVCRIFYDMKVRKCSTPEEIKKRKKAVIFCLSADKKCIVVEEGKEILVGDVGETITDPFKHFVGMLPEKDCRYALYDASFETKESRKEELMFFLWAPEHAPLKSKMIYASSKDAIKKKFQGIKHEYQANGPEDLNRTSIAEKLGGSLIVAFEGSPI